MSRFVWVSLGYVCCLNVMINGNNSTLFTLRSILIWMVNDMVTLVILPNLNFTR